MQKVPFEAQSQEVRGSLAKQAFDTLAELRKDPGAMPKLEELIAEHGPGVAFAARFDAKTGDRHWLISRCAEWGLADALARLLAGVSLDAAPRLKNQYPAYPPLFSAAKGGSVRCVELLLAAGARVDERFASREGGGPATVFDRWGQSLERRRHTGEVLGPLLRSAAALPADEARLLFWSVARAVSIMLPVSWALGEDDQRSFSVRQQILDNKMPERIAEGMPLCALREFIDFAAAQNEIPFEPEIIEAMRVEHGRKEAVVLAEAAQGAAKAGGESAKRAAEGDEPARRASARL
jgi:hypothetical protein